MTVVYDNWQRLVEGTLKRQKYRELALAPSSRNTSFSSTSISSSAAAHDNLSARFEFEFISLPQQHVTGTYSYPIVWAEQVEKAAEEAASYKQECMELKSKTKRLTFLLHQVARADNNLYDRPAIRIMDDTSGVIEKALSLILKCRSVALIAIIPPSTFRRALSQLESSISNVSWLISTYHDYEYGVVPPIAADKPYLSFIWEKINILYKGSVEDRSKAAESLVSLAHDSDLQRRSIIEEGGVRPILKLLEDGNLEGQENAARAIKAIGKDPESISLMFGAGLRDVFDRILREGPMKVRAKVAWVVSELALQSPEPKRMPQIPLLVHHLSLQALREYSEYDFVRVPWQVDSATEANLGAMVARALCHLVKGDSAFCRRIIWPSVLLHLAVLLETGPEEAKYNTAMALMEITAVAENDAELRKSIFKRNSPSCKAVVDQLLGAVEKEVNSELVVIPCVEAIGNLARIFEASETEVIRPLVKLLNIYRDSAVVCSEACITLAKFTTPDNPLCVEHSRAIISAGQVENLVQLVYSSAEQIVQSPALILLRHIALNVPESELPGGEVFTLLRWASKQASTRI